MATTRRLPLELRVAYLAMDRQADACLATSKCTADHSEEREALIEFLSRISKALSARSGREVKKAKGEPG